MLLFAGLGNPGRRYAGHRHNVGFMAADAIHRRHAFPQWSRKFNALVADGRLGEEKVLLIKPQAFMNLSGQAVGKAMRFFKLAPADIVVFYDEIDLAPGKVRVKTGGGHGGHNGIRSIEAHCGKAFRRVRIGIGHPGDKAQVNTHVLGDFARADQAWLDPLLDAIGDAAPLLAAGEDSSFMNKVSLAVPREGGKADKAPSKTKGEGEARQAPSKEHPAATAEDGPMAAMLKRLFGGRQ